MARFQTIIYLLGLLVGNPASLLYFLLLLIGRTLVAFIYLVLTNNWVAGKSRTPLEMHQILVIMNSCYFTVSDQFVDRDNEHPNINQGNQLGINNTIQQQK